LDKTSRKSSVAVNARRQHRRARSADSSAQLVAERLEDRLALSALSILANANELIDTSLTPTELAMSLVGPGVSVSNVSFTGGASSTGSFSFADPSVVGFAQGIVMSSGNAADVVGPNASDSTGTDFGAPGDANLDNLSGFTTFDAAVLEFDFVPTANQVVFQYAFASDEYPEWVNTQYNDVFAFFVNGTNYAEVRQIAGDPFAPFVAVAVNNINNSNPEQDPPPEPMRPDLFRANYWNPDGPSAIDLELDGITSVLTFQAPVNPGEVNHMKLAIADASDGIYDSAVFIQSGSLVSNENPVADLSLSPERGDAPLVVTAIVEGEDPNGAPLTYSIDWGDGAISTGLLDQPTDDNEKTALVDHTYTVGGEYFVTLTVSNGTLSGVSVEDVDVFGGIAAPDTMITAKPADPSNDSTPSFEFSSTVAGATFEYQLDGGSFVAGASGDVLGPLADGMHTFQVRAKDADGNLDPTPASYEWTIDTAAPDTAITAQPTDPTSDNTPSFSFTSTETGGSFEYQVDGGGFVSGASGDVLGPLAEGAHTFQVRAIDAAGNVDPTPASYAWTIDATPPDTMITAQPADPTSDATPTFEFTSTEAGVTFEYQLDGGGFVLGISGDELEPLADGVHTFEVRAVDAVGNVDPTPASYTWTIAAAPVEASAAIVADPQKPGKFLLEVTGTPLDDSLLIDRQGQKTQVWDKQTEKLLGVFANADYGRIVAFGLGGNDTIIVDAKMTKPAELHGDGGDDELFGGAADDALFGDEGNDRLYGREGNDTLVGGVGDDILYGMADDDVLDAVSGNDVLLGGRGADELLGGGDGSLLIGGAGRDDLLGSLAGDILISGHTDYDANEAALLALLAEWKRTDLTYDQRIDHLTGKTADGLNGGFYLKAKTVKNDVAVDSIWGGEGDDWFWARPKEVGDQQPGEQLN
jgi:Ca2+-binding RTX toxin-like protein